MVTEVQFLWLAHNLCPMNNKGKTMDRGRRLINLAISSSKLHVPENRSKALLDSLYMMVLY